MSGVADRGALERLSVCAGYCLSAILIAAIVATVALAFRYGTDRGDEGKLTLTGRGQFVLAVCGILTRVKYDAGRYVCSSGVVRQMQQIGLWYDEETLGRVGKTTEQWLADTKFLNRALDRIFALKAPPEGYPSAFGWGGDSGYMDFVQVAFLLFGHTVQALYYGFFLLLAISAGLFCVQFRRHHFALFAALAFAFGFLTFLRLLPSVGLVLANNPHDPLDSVNNPRFLSVLTLIPLFHALFLIVYRVRPGLWPIILFTPQAMLTAAAADFRSLAFASPLALTVCCVVFLMSELWRRKPPLRQALPRYWPTYAVFACIGVSAVLQAATVDWHIAASGGMRFHTFWEPMYYDLQLHPQWKEKYAAQHHGATGDEVAMVGAELYEQRHHLPHWTSDLGYERAVRGAYIDFVRNDPWYVVQLKYYNALTIIDFVASVIAIEWTSLNWPLLILAACVAAALVSQIRRKQESLGTLAVYTAALGFSAVLIAIPVWATVVEGQIFADLTLCFVAWTFTAVPLMLVAVGIFLSERVPRLGNGSGWLRSQQSAEK
jgi:hypothetical protein